MGIRSAVSYLHSCRPDGMAKCNCERSAPEVPKVQIAYLRTEARRVQPSLKNTVSEGTSITTSAETVLHEQIRLSRKLATSISHCNPTKPSKLINLGSTRLLASRPIWLPLGRTVPLLGSSILGKSINLPSESRHRQSRYTCISSGHGVWPSLLDERRGIASSHEVCPTGIAEPVCR